MQSALSVFKTSQSLAKDVDFHRLAATAVKFCDSLVVSVSCPGVDCGDSFVTVHELVAVGADSLFPNEAMSVLIKREDSVDCPGFF